MKKLEFAQMEQLHGGADPCSGVGWWSVTLVSAAAAVSMGIVNPALGYATSVGLSAAHASACP